MLSAWHFSLILLLASWLLSTVAGDAFRVISTPRRGTRGNDFFLRCQNLTSSSIGTFSVLNRPQFLRNGLEFSQDECMKDSELFSNGSIAVHVSPSCEGYIQCGTSEVLSPSFTLYAYPEKLNEGMEVQSLEGSNVTLHCPLVVSTLNSLSITWFRIINGHTTTVSDGSISDKDYSLTLFEVTVLKAGYYHCRAVSNALSDGKFRILIGPQVRLSVTMKHERVQFLTSMTYVPDASSRYTFRISASGTPPLVFNWFIGSKNISSVESRITGDDSLVNMTSEVGFNRLPAEISSLSVFVSNTDPASSETHTVLERSIILPHVINGTCISNGTTSGFMTLVIRYGTVSLAVLSVLFFIIIIALTALTCHLRRHRQRHCCKCKTLLRGDSSLTNATNVSSLINETPLTQDPPVLCRNPIAAILIETGNMYKDRELDKLTFTGSLQHILIDVLSKGELNEANTQCAEILQENIAKFSKILRRGGSFPFISTSRQISIESGVAADRGSTNKFSLNLFGDTRVHNGPRGSFAVSPLRDNVVRPCLSPQRSTSEPTKDGEGRREYCVRQTSSEEYRKAQENLIPIPDNGTT